jgi:hypothetical protein
MSHPTKIHLSDREMQLVTNVEWIMIKKEIIKKVFDVFGRLHLQMVKLVEDSSLPGIVKENKGKIYKGENYLDLPYVMMDYPARFSKTDVFAIRTMFWWGNYFSITLHVSGIYKQPFQKKLKDSFSVLQKKGFYICVHEEEWHHHFENSNYKQSSDISLEEVGDIIQKDFFKVGKIIPLAEWDNAQSDIMKYFKEIIQMVTQNLVQD